MASPASSACLQGWAEPLAKAGSCNDWTRVTSGFLACVRVCGVFITSCLDIPGLDPQGAFGLQILVPLLWAFVSTPHQRLS